MNPEWESHTETQRDRGTEEERENSTETFAFREKRAWG